MADQMGESAFAATIERMTSRIVNSMVIAAAIVGLAIYARPGPPRYEAVATSDGRVVRVNRANGSIVSCDAVRCSLVYRSGQDLDRAEGQRALPKQPAVPQLQPPAAERPAAPQPGADPAPAPER